MIISILNCDINWGIGKKNGLLFNLPLDMKFFRETTKGHVVCMGENTLLSFPGSKPLKNRTNIVLSQDETHNYDEVVSLKNFISKGRLNNNPFFFPIPQLMSQLRIEIIILNSDRNLFF